MKNKANYEYKPNYDYREYAMDIPLMLLAGTFALSILGFSWWALHCFNSVVAR